MKKRLSMKSFPPAFYMTILLMIGFGIFTDHFFSPDNLTMILRQAAPLLVIACGQTLIVLMQGTDLSQGSVVSFVCVLWIWLLQQGIPMGLCVLLVAAAAFACGTINGVIVAKGFLPIFIVTLGTQNIFKSCALLLSGSETIYFRDPIFRTIAKGTFLRLSWSTWIALACFGFTVFLLNFTRFGMRVKGLGGNPESLSLSGASISLNQILAFAYAGLMAGIGGMLLCCRIESGNPNAGTGLEFNAIAAVLLGGTSMREGKGGAGGTIVGVLMIQVLRTGLTQVGLSSIYQNAIIGTVVLAAIIIDAVVKLKTEV